ncbi:temptin-like [Mytilus galloprovincialis]|uniref:Temptin Cys/Cys disulfide domain-containing protein n=1 Tax=Mytilus galloprovincialis TaxID=29158 RepID=A0A8B6HLY8_MYTGA|nr:Hypothetical predicted protein [Mytilus galloprovincialis]
MKMLVHITLALSVVGTVLCRPNYRDGIPNGYSVPNMCGTSAFWDPVGHMNPFHHTKSQNPFGAAYSASGRSWLAICNEDSDRDGKTNGEELGDPNCVWRPGQTPDGNAIGHPGICEPVGSQICSLQNFRCDCLEHC